ncbi:DUF4265 domain-containing protein [Pseudonocardia oroxyli]|uniref:DUF4265 domain-containing protein n=1 Tax=Pseudonocardia oroxyli TaxID=366584 RepID=UPI001C40B99C|nr:DUF4265 domain-containing protein [Pseudonocardia oroxyli]
MAVREAVHRDPVWRARSNHLIAAEVQLDGTDIATEQLWARRIGADQFELCCIPFFVYDLALGDVVEVDDSSLVRSVLSPSGRYVFRVFFERSNLVFRDEIVRGLESLQSIYEWSSASLLAVDARDEAHASIVAEYLADGERSGMLLYETGKS